MEELRKAKRKALISMGILLLVMAFSVLWIVGCFFLLPALRHEGEPFLTLLVGGTYTSLSGFFVAKLMLQGIATLESFQNWTNVENELKNRLPKARVL